MIILLAISFLSLMSCCCICTSEDTAEVEFSKCKRKFFKFCIRVTQRTLLFGFGVLWIETKKLKIKDFDSDYPYKNYEKRDELNEPPVIIANHTGMLDPMYLSSTKYCPSFVAKDMVKKTPLVGNAARTAQCIFV